MPAAGGSLQGVGAGEPVRAEAATPPVGLRIETAGLHSFRDLCTLLPRLSHKGVRSLERDCLAGGQVDDIKLQSTGIDIERGSSTHCVQRHLKIALASGHRPSRLVVEDPPAGLRAVDPVDDATQPPTVHVDGERLLEKFRRRLEATTLSIRL